MKTTGMVVGLILAAGGVGMAHALWGTQAPLQPSTLDLVHRLDVDGDGAISRGEYDRVSDGQLSFATVDLDGDGALQPRELEVLVTHISPLADLGNRLPRVR